MRCRPVAVFTVAAIAGGGLAGCSGRTTAATTTVPVTASTSTTPIEPVTGASTSTSVAIGVTGLRTNADIAATITRAERGLRGSTNSGPDTRVLAIEQQRAYRAAATDSSQVDAILALVPAELRPVARANITAGVELRTLTKPRTALPPWHIVAPAPVGELLADYHDAERRYGVGWEYLAAVHLVETRMGRIRGDSTAGAQGPMQFLPSTWKQYGEGGDIGSNRDAILAAARLLKHNGAPARMNDALFAYNRSPHYVTAVSLYAARMRADAHAYAAYYEWQVWYRLETGDVLLPVGYPDVAAEPGKP